MSVRSVVRFGVPLAFIAWVTGASVSAAPPVACPEGVFAVDPSIALGSIPVTRIILADGQASLPGSCSEPAPAKRKAKRKATVVSARWASCPGLPGPVVLKARLAIPACDMLVGTLTAKRTKPKRQRFQAHRLGDAEVALTSLADVEVQARMLAENFPAMIRPAIETYNPEATALIALGPSAVPMILAAFDRPPTLVDDMTLAILAYVLERIGDPSAVAALATWLDTHLFSETIWVTDFVTHTIRVLADLGGLDTTLFTYDIETKLDTIRAALAGATAGGTGASVQAAAAPESGTGVCFQKILVTGLNASGQQETIELNYRVAAQDIQDVIADPATDPVEKMRAERRLTQWREADETAYGGTDYEPLPGADVSIRSNCAGTVTERILNAVAANRGFAVRLGPGGGTADVIRGLARTFGGEVPLADLDPFTVVSHDNTESGFSHHVEVPIEADAESALVYSKDDYGRLRQHRVGKTTFSTGGFAAARAKYEQRAWYEPGTTVVTKFYRVDPARILSIVVDTSACPCVPGAPGNIPVAITQPSTDETPERVVAIGGTVGEPTVTSGTLRLNGAPQAITVSGGGFSTPAVLRSGQNTIGVTVDAPDGRRGCATRTITSTTPKTTLSVTLTWSLDATDVDLYVTQPDGETAWYSDKTTTAGGQLDVDDTNGFGPENYFLSAIDGDTVTPGTYVVRVHYYGDHQDSDEVPTRVVAWRAEVLVDEGTPTERRTVHSGQLSVANSGNTSPGSSGPDWATAAEVVIMPAPE